LTKAGYICQMAYLKVCHLMYLCGRKRHVTAEHFKRGISVKEGWIITVPANLKPSVESLLLICLVIQQTNALHEKRKS
jgi:hypothetical protein